jgi:asparagine synthase (glutamine-hydrolysing)
MIDFLISLDKKATQLNVSSLFVIQPLIKLSISNEEIEFLAWGDPICDNQFKNKLLNNKSVDFIVNNLYGHYYYLLFDKIQNTICVGNSLFSVLPVYYFETKDEIKISNDPFRIGDAAGLSKYSKRFLLENILFKYPLFNQSCIDGVILLSSNHYIQIFKGTVNYFKHTAIENYFDRSPRRWKNALEKMSDLFIECSDKYFPDYLFASALTGGFDGRTLVSCSINKKKNFFTYSFGNEESSDIPIAEYLSNKYNLPFYKIMLDINYLKNFSLNEGLGFIKGSSGTASFARAHYLFAAKILSHKSGCLITGNFGSEVLRAPNNIGVMFSQNLNVLFKSGNFDSAINILKSSDEYEFLNIKNFAVEFDSLKDDLEKLPCFDPAYKQLSKNQQFYIFIFEEIFRKYFGAEMVNQFKYLSNRTPFLDIDFLKGILGTEL